MKILVIILLSSVAAFSQTDTLSLTLPEAQKQFADRNLLLLAQKYNVEAQKAQVIQAGLLPNPNVGVQQSLMARKALVNDVMVGGFGQHAVVVQQLILLAGRRNKNIRLAEINAEQSQYAFYDLMRTLNYSLNQNFYELAFQLRTLAVYEQEIQTISKLVTAYKELNKDGNAPLKDVARLESFQFSLQTSMNNLELVIAQNQADLRTLLGISANVYLVPRVDVAVTEGLTVKNLAVSALIETAQANRYDLKLKESSVRFSTANLALQKALKTPNLNVMYTYDNAGGYTNYYHGVTLSMDLPIFNRNQGNIKTAAFQIDANQKYYEQSQMDVANQVLAAYNQVVKTEQLYQTFDKTFVPTFTKLIEGVMEGYQKKTISLVEFMDFFDSYKQNIEQFNNFQNNRVQAYNYLGFVVGKANFQ
jgi:outer membrane protein, heavy metal efflux system